MSGKWRFINHDNKHFGIQFGDEGGFMLHPDIPDAQKKVVLMHTAPEMYEALRAIAMCGFKREDGETWCKCSPNDYDLERAHALLAKIDATNSPEQGKGG